MLSWRITPVAFGVEPNGPLRATHSGHDTQTGNDTCARLRNPPDRANVYGKFASMNRFPKLFTLLLTTGLAAFAQQYTINTVAGIGGVLGYNGDAGPATQAQLVRPFRVTVDSSGNIYIVDYYSYRIREVTASTGIINTIAGDGTPGYAGDGAAAIDAEIYDVHGIAVDSSGNVYIADTDNGRVRKIDTSGNINTIAGNGAYGYTGDGAAATAAALWFPSGLAFDSSGNLYISDYGNSTVRKIDSKGIITTVAGTGSYGFSGDGGSASKAALAYPYAITFDSSGNLLIADLGNTNIRKVDTSGNISTLISGITPEDIAVDSTGAIYFVDGVSSIVQKILPGGTIIPVAGNGTASFNGDGGPANQAEVDQPQGVATDTSGNVYVADTQNQVIREMTPIPFSFGAALNAASSQGGPIAPGEIVTLYGVGVGPSTLTQYTPNPDGSIPTTIAGVQVFFDSSPAPLLYVSATQIAAIVPYSMQNAGTAQVSVNYNGAASVATPFTVGNTAPGIFTSNTTGSGQAAAVNTNGTLNNTSNPAHIGDIISLYATGEGQTTPGGVDGKLAPLTPPYPMPIANVTATIGGQPAQVTYYGAAPGEVAGLMQVNIQIPAGIQPGNVPVVLTVGGVVTTSAVTVAVTQ